MTYPPQQPGPYGQEPHGQQPGPYGQDPTAQYGQQPPGYGGYPGGPGGPPPPKKTNAGVIAAVVAGAVLVLGGAGTGIYFLTKGDDTPSNTASTGGQTSTSKPKTSGSQPKTRTSDRTESATPPRTSSGGGGGGGGGGGAGDAAIIEVAEKYAKAVTDKDEGAAKSLTCENDTGLLFDSGGKVEVTGKPETYGEDSASINVKVTLGSGDPIEDFPLFLDKKDAGWCVSV
ncbi:MAG TPA: hypothetical protein VGX25_28725 [Actinophytocola sp.]|uniref:hypothetical protein n=1 Tax=Actinophytocola sp. TaxID=1872138 RepID=UPI002DDD648C|nr:hypothetical protein [Actinophytocola sp.]HEV2783387.1 hypothetical protein [Actinophytocola sp.]